MNNFPLEADTRILINNSLNNLGWRFEGTDKNVFVEQPRTDVERRKLSGKRPDYVLYSKSGEPLAVIEAKKKGVRIDDALNQGIDYARKLEAPLVFATDGVFYKTFHTKANRTPLLNGEEIDELVREVIALQYLNKWEVNTVSPKVQYDRKELIRVFDEANNMLRGDGLRAGIERFGEFANILFLKLISENEKIKKESGIESKFDPSCDWDSIKRIPITARIEYINKTVRARLNTLYKTEIFTDLELHDENILKEIMDKLDPLNLSDVDSDIKGDAFEYFLKATTASKNDLGEYFTPRHIVKTMVRLVNPQIGEKVYDPFCGTGGFLIETYRHIYNNMARTQYNIDRLRENTVFGNEITNTARITKMNMILAGDGHSNISKADSLAQPVDGLYDVVLTNMPYSQKTNYGSYYDLPSKNGDSICVQHCIKAINSTAENGRMALVVPEGFLFRRDLSRTREYLLDRSHLQSIISLPPGVFLPYTGVKTDIIFATKVNSNKKLADRQERIWYFDVKSDGYSLDNHRRKLDKQNDLSIYEEYRKFDNEHIDDLLKVGFDIIPVAEVKKNAFVLVGSRYKQSPTNTSNYPQKSLKEICDIVAGQSPDSLSFNSDNNGLPFYQGNADFGDMFIKPSKTWTTQITKEAFCADILLSVRAPVGEVNICNEKVCIGRGLMAIRCKKDVNHIYLFFVLKSLNHEFEKLSMGSTFKAITRKDVEDFIVPLPSLEIQQRIAEELEEYQNIITSAKSIVETYSPRITINSDWEKLRIGDLCNIATGSTPSTKDRTNYDNGEIKWLVSGDIHKDFIYDCSGRVTEKGKNTANLKFHKAGSVLIALNGQGKTRGSVAILKTEATCNQSLVSMYPKDNRINSEFLYYILKGMYQQIRDITGDSYRSGLNMPIIRDITIPVPTREEQERLVNQLREEKMLIDSARNLAKTFSEKIETRVAEMWKSKS